MIEREKISPENTEDAEAIIALCDEGARFLSSFAWCRSVRRVYFDRGFRHLAVLFCEIDPIRTADPEVWVVVGDAPPAYLDTFCKNGAEALLLYCWWLEVWAKRVRSHDTVADCMPVLARNTYQPVEPSPEYAEMLLKRSKLIKRSLLEESRDEISPEVMKEFGSVLNAESSG
jgi:hypothetical protein